MKNPSQTEGIFQIGLSKRNLTLSILSIFLANYLIRSFNDSRYSLNLEGFNGPRVTKDGQTIGGAKGNSAGSCRMTWMNPSYLPIPIRSVKSRYHSKYSLYLYRDLEFDLEKEPYRSPVLFIPGNAGSFRQVRSLASVTSQSYCTSLQSPHSDYLRRSHPGRFYLFCENMGPTTQAKRRKIIGSSTRTSTNDAGGEQCLADRISKENVVTSKPLQMRISDAVENKA